MSRLLLVLTLAATSAFSAELVFESDFESGLDRWGDFRKGANANVEISDGSLLGKPSGAAGLVALTREFDGPQTRLMIEFSFAFGGGSRNGRSLNVWTHEPGGVDASQLNLCIEAGALRQFDGRIRSWEAISREVKSSQDPDHPTWHRVRAVFGAGDTGIDYWLSEPGSLELPDRPTATMAAYRSGLAIGAVDFVSGRRIAEGNWYRIDDLKITGGLDLPAPEPPPAPRAPSKLWTGSPIPRPAEIPFVDGLEHRIIHRAREDGFNFLHGSALVEHEGVFYANWANSPVDENSAEETMQGRRSTDGGKTWGDLKMIGSGFDGPNRHSHGVLFVHDKRVCTIAARYGIGEHGTRYDGLSGELFVLGDGGDWESRGIAMRNCWPYSEPFKMGNGNLITGGQSGDGLPVVAISKGDDISVWKSVLIPFHPILAPIFAETTVWAENHRAIAVIRGGGGVAWVSTSEDFGETWTEAEPSNLPMPRAKAYIGKLSTGQLYLLSNLRNRDTLVISTGRPGEMTLSKMWRIRHGRSEAPRFKGARKFPQWSYPYGYEHDGKLYVLYSVGKEDCGMSVFPVAALAAP